MYRTACMYIVWVISLVFYSFQLIFYPSYSLKRNIVLIWQVSYRMKSIVHLLKSSNMIKVKWKNCLNILDNSVYLLDHQCRIYSWNISFVALQLLTVEDFVIIARKEFHLLHLGMSCDQFFARTPHVTHRTFELIATSTLYACVRQKCMCDLFKNIFKHTMAIWVVKFSREGFKIMQIFGQIPTYSKEISFLWIDIRSVKLSKIEHHFRK